MPVLSTMEEVSDMELQAMLKKLNWPVLKEKKPEYVVSIITKALRKKGIVFYKNYDRKKVKVVPVTKWDPKDPVKHDTEYVYEIWRGVTGEILKEREVGEDVLCQVLLRPKGRRPFTTEIKKDDLCETQPKSSTKDS